MPRLIDNDKDVLDKYQEYRNSAIAIPDNLVIQQQFPTCMLYYMAVKNKLVS
ncbi:MAG: hypothetical protein K0R14_277 [Burkholderiales bacterium]|jgi:hypothetical protein|nr:hypothetical protein [Burkholderiales bacterium]